VTLVPNIGLLVGAAAGGGKFTPAAPTLSYAGSGTTNNGKFTITNYNATFIYTATGGTVASDVLTVTATTGSAVLTAKSPKGLTQSASITAYRQAANLVNVPYTQCYNPCGDCNPGGNPATWTCGCGSGCNDSGGGQWGVCICRGPGYSYYENYGPSGYTWSGADYTNGQGEWWKIA
jgi:hypothetical protein